MGAIKEKMFEIAEIIQQMMDEGVQDFEVDEYLEAQLTPEDYQFYHQNKDVIFQHFLGYMNESLSKTKFDPSLPGKVFKYTWTDDSTVYYMVLEDSYVPREKYGKDASDSNIWYLTTRLATISKHGKWLVPYTDDIYHIPGEKQGSQRSGYADITKYTPITDKDKQKLITLFQKPRYLSYLEEIFEDEGIVPDFLKHLLNNVDECYMPSLFAKNINEESRYNVPYQGFGEEPDEEYGIPADQDSFDEQEFVDEEGDWTFQEGDKVIFDIKGMETEWQQAEEQEELAISHSGQVAIIISQATATEIGDKNYEYYDIEFGDGIQLIAVSGYNLEPAYEKPDINPAGEPDINPKNIGKYRNPYKESKEELFMPSLFEGCGCGKKRVGSIPVRRPAPPVKLPIPPKSPNPR